MFGNKKQETDSKGAKDKPQSIHDYFIKQIDRYKMQTGYIPKKVYLHREDYYKIDDGHDLINYFLRIAYNRVSMIDLLKEEGANDITFNGIECVVYDKITGFEEKHDLILERFPTNKDDHA